MSGLSQLLYPKWELSNVQRHVLAADLVESADNAALEDAPEALDRVRVDGADDILAGGMMDAAVIEFGQSVIGTAFVGREQADPVRHHLADEGLRGFGFIRSARFNVDSKSAHLSGSISGMSG